MRRSGNIWRQAEDPGRGTSVSGFYQINCAKSAVLGEAEDPALPYTVEVMFDDCHRN